MRRLLKSGGDCECELARTVGSKPDPAEAREVIAASDLVFIGGGDVEEGMQVLEQRKVTATLQQKRAQGTPVFGVSAGAIMLGRQWVRWRDPDDDTSAELFDCLGFADVVCDTHGEKDRWAELHALLALAGEGARGYGIRTNAAVRVEGGEVEVLVGKVDALQLRNGQVVAAAPPPPPRR